MTTVAFNLFEMNDYQDALTLEGVYQRYASFAGVQKFKFDDSIRGFKSAKWTTITNVSYSGDYVSITGGGTAAVSIAWFADAMPHSFVADMYAHLGTWGFAVRGNGSDTYYKILYDSTRITLYKTVSAGDQTFASKALHGEEIITGSKVRIAVSDAQFSADSPGRIIYISVWVNDQLLLSFSDNVQDNIPPLRFGVVIPVSSATTLYSNLRVANMGEMIVWSSEDPGENPQGAIQRAIEDRYIKSWIRWDGSLRAWKPVARTTYLTIPTTKDLGLQRILDIKQIFSHVRMLGAFQWVQVSDPDLERRFGHRFREVNNTALWNADDCFREAQRLITRAKEQANMLQMNTIGLIYAELEDRLKLPDMANAGSYIDYIIDSIDWTAEAATLKANLRVRQYYYGEP